LKLEQLTVIGYIDIYVIIRRRNGVQIHIDQCAMETCVPKKLVKNTKE